MEKFVPNRNVFSPHVFILYNLYGSLVVLPFYCL